MSTDIWSLCSKEILLAKQEHCATFLEEMSYSDVWTENKYISTDGRDGGKARVPMLTLPTPGAITGSVTVATSNDEKAKILVSVFFPRRP